MITGMRGCVTVVVGWVDVPYSDWSDFRRRRAIDISSLAMTLPILWIIFTCDTNTTHKGTMYHIPFPGE